MTYEIKKGVPIPGSTKNAPKYPFRDMAVGDMFDAPYEEHKVVRNATNVYAYRHPGLKFTTRRVVLNGEARICIWRIL